MDILTQQKQTVHCEVLTEFAQTAECEVLKDIGQNLGDRMGQSGTKPTEILSDVLTEFGQTLEKSIGNGDTVATDDTLCGTDRPWTDFGKSAVERKSQIQGTVKCNVLTDSRGL